MSRITPSTPDPRLGLAELAAARAASHGALAVAFVFSIFVNLLMLTSPLYMLQVYDRVLVSRSEETLVTLTLLVAFLFLIMGILDSARSRIMARVGARVQLALDRRVMSAAFRRLSVAPGDTAALAAQRDLDALARFWASPVLLALFDAPWTPVFVAAIFFFHPLLGALAIGAGILLALFAWANQRLSHGPQQAAHLATLAAEREAENLKSDAALVWALGMTGAAFNRWSSLRGHALERGLVASDISGRFSVLTRTFRIFLQSAILGLAAWLVLQHALSAGAMIATSVLIGRALQPLEQAVSQWSVVARALQARTRLSGLLSGTEPEPRRTRLPRPNGALAVQGLSVAPPGTSTPVLRGVSFALQPGQALGVIGPSGAGKSTLVRVLTGVWQPMVGQIRLDGATLDQYDQDDLGSYVGVLPQRVSLFDGTVAENIARLQPDAAPEKIVAAAQAAAAHDLILRLPDGYDTRVSTLGSQLSGGQVQRIGLARALYGDPALLILDEPNANLDNDGSIALNTAIRAAKARGAAILIMAHRPAAIQECEQLLVLQDGVVTAFGPRDTVLRDAVRNAGDITRSVRVGGMA